MKKKWILITLFLGAIHLYAQEEEEDIKKEDVVVEFSFNPTLTDVFKLKTVPSTEKKFAKQKVEYKIHPKQVPSDFVPIVKQATYVDVDKAKPINYQNYLYGAFGLYKNAELEAIIRPNEINGYRYGLDLSSYKIQNGIKDQKVENGQWKTNLDLFLSKNNQNNSWITKFRYDRNQIHWYGLNSDIPKATYQNQDIAQTYNLFLFSSDIEYQNSKIKSLSPSIYFFSDSFKSSEIGFNLETVFDKSMFYDFISAKIDLEYLNGGFEQGYLSGDKIEYTFFNLGVTPSYFYQGDGFQVDAEAGFLANVDREASSTDFLFLPKLQVDVSLIENVMTLSGGVRSGFNQNSYKSFANKNPFVSPTLNIKATHTPMDAFLGLSGKLTKTITYYAETSYKQIKNNAFFIHNNSQMGAIKPYQMGNSFDVIYDDVNVFSVKGKVEAKLMEQVTGGIIGTYNNYDMKKEKEPWNLPNITVETYLNYTDTKWFGQLGLNVVGNRKDLVASNTKDVNGFLDINLKTGYKINDRWNIHANLYNLLNKNYQSYINYQVQGFQAMGGLSFKF